MVKQSFEQLHEFMKDLPQYKFDNDDVMEQLDLMLVDLNKQKLSGFPRAVSLTFLPEREPPQYPPAPEPFRSLTLRKKHRDADRLKIQSLPAGVGSGYPRESIASESSISQGATSPGDESVVSSPMIVPMVKEEAAEAAASGGNLAEATSAGASSAVSEGTSAMAEGELKSQAVVPSELKLQDTAVAGDTTPANDASPATPHVEDGVSTPLAMEPGDSVAAKIPGATGGIPTENGGAEASQTSDAGTGVPQLANGDIGGQYEKEQLHASGSDSSLRIRVSTI